MNKTFLIILVAVLIFIGVNSFFYIRIFREQRDFQAELLTQQIRICGSTIEQNGMNFESEVNYILFSDNISMLFSDSEVKERSSKNLELFYSKYENLINYINIFDNNYNVYRLLKDKVNNYVSDFYESQRQETLAKRDMLKEDEGRFLYTVPIFQDNEVTSNIIININFEKYINTVFDQYRLENTLWQWILTEDGELTGSQANSLGINEREIERISNDILEGNEGTIVHTIQIDGEPVRVISVYYPISLIRKEFGIVFSMKSDLFLRSIISKTIIITAASLLLLALILYLIFRVIKVKSADAIQYKVSETALRKLIDDLAVGVIVVQEDKNIRSINQTAKKYLNIKSDQQEIIKDTTWSLIDIAGTDEPLYQQAFGQGSLVRYSGKDHEKFFFRQIRETLIQHEKMLLVSILDVSSLESDRKQSKLAHHDRNKLIENMKSEIALPVQQIRKELDILYKQKSSGSSADSKLVLNKSLDLLSNLIDAAFDFSLSDPDQGVFDQIPFSLRDELNISIEPLKASSSGKNISIIMKIRKDVPDRVIGDPFKFRQVFQNLLENSIALTEEGRILISAETVIHQADLLIIRFLIEDTGGSLPENILSVYKKPEEPSLDITGKDSSDKTGMRILIARQQIELMKGDFQIESPSSITTNPSYPGTKYSFTLDLIPDESYKQQLDYSAITELANIHCLLLTRDKDLEEEYYKPFNDVGIQVKQRIYNQGNLDSLAEFLREGIHQYHLLLVPEKVLQDDLHMLSFLLEQDLTDKFLIMVLNTGGESDNLLPYKKQGADYYLKIPFNNKRIREIIRHHFSGIPSKSIKDPGDQEIRSDLSILLADDNEISRKIAQSIFKNLGFEIDLARNGNEAIEKLKSGKYDIIFMDLLMPEKDGFEAGSEIRSLGYDLPIVALTAVEPEVMSEKARKAGINDYIIKPAAIENLRNILAKHCPG